VDGAQEVGVLFNMWTLILKLLIVIAEIIEKLIS